MATDAEFAIPEYPDGSPFMALWPNCAMPDCPNKACTWSELPTICFPCGEARLGKDAMIQRYNDTHDEPYGTE